MTDEERAIFVRQAYRYVTSIDPDLLAMNPKAIQVDIDSNLTESGDAQAIADLFKQANTHPRVFNVEIEGLMNLSSFQGSPPAFTVQFPRYAAKDHEYTVTGASISYEKGTTTLEIRG